MAMSSVRSWVPDVLGRILVFLFFLLVFSFLLYLLGNSQDFLDATQGVLLRILEFTGLLYIILSIFFLIGRIVEWVLQKRSKLRDILVGFGGLLVAGTLVVLTEFILVIS